MKIKENTDLKFMPETEEIDGDKFTVYPFSAIEALRIKATLLKAIGPALGELIGGVKNIEDLNLDANINGESISNGIEKLFGVLDEDTFVNLIKRILKNTVCILSSEEGKEQLELSREDAIDKVFRKRTLMIYQVIIFVLKVNYPDFFRVVGGFGSRIKTFMSETIEKNTNK